MTQDAADRYRLRSKTSPLYLGAFMDLVVFSFLRISYFIKGTASYLMKRTHWDKLSRTNNEYILS